MSLSPLLPGTADAIEPRLSARENARAIDRIEHAERTEPYCLCGTHMIAVADSRGDIYLSCARREPAGSGLRGFLRTFGHSRRLILDRPGR